MKKVEKNSLYGSCKIKHHICDDCGFQVVCHKDEQGKLFPECIACVFIGTIMNEYPCNKCRGIHNVSDCHFIKASK